MTAEFSQAHAAQHLHALHLRITLTVLSVLCQMTAAEDARQAYLVTMAAAVNARRI